MPVLIDYAKLIEDAKLCEEENRKNFPEQCADIENFLAMGWNTWQEINEEYKKEYNKTAVPVSDKESFQFFISSRNLRFFEGAYMLFLKGMPSPAYALLRNTLETSLTMYSVQYTTKLDEFYRKEWDASKQMAKLIEKEAPISEIKDEDDKLKKLATGGTTIRRLADDLYEGGRRDRLKITGSVLDEKAHANIRGMQADISYKESEQRTLVDYMRVLSAFHTLAVIEGFNSKLSERTLQSCIDYMKTVGNRVGRCVYPPNKKGIIEQLIYKHPPR